MTTATPFAFASDKPVRASRAVGFWLLGCCTMVLAMAVIGAITRLTESGLSIMEWAPVSGVLPPLSQGEWQRLFDLYRQIPEYQQVNAGMSLAEFKAIFWWEYIHRLWGRLIGLVFALPFAWFWWRGKLDGRMTRLLLLALLLGGLQGFMGWFMVASGFGERTDVSQYRLVAHLGLALGIYGYLFWLALGQFWPRPERSRDPAAGRLRRSGFALLALVALTILSGGFVAGLNAGLVYNTFPLMDGDLVPAGYALLAPWPLNLFENHAAVQFNHRLLAVSTIFVTLAIWLWSLRQDLSPAVQGGFALLAILALLQLALGIVTLLLVVPIWAAALHQAGAIFVLTAILWCLYHLRVRNPA
ncbi:heme A synthase [Pelagibius litoralis]|uniref:Heme A synthase n=1 Tax=Pelagibius litoralis TaxID=374515 RepID=A0A967F1W1_9PROT|nr:COX15/CtaA family protein [Pelagibius litoralis]NIA71555.1 heme A synthase [Pelagibius litoralis]